MIVLVSCLHVLKNLKVFFFFVISCIVCEVIYVFGKCFLVIHI